MSYKLRYDQDVDCIFLTFEDTVTVDVIQKVAPEVARMSEETGCYRMLNDMSDATIEMSFIDVFGSPKIMDESHVSRKIRRALVVPFNFTEAAFLENVTRNRGHDLKVFEDVEKARQWLLAE